LAAAAFYPKVDRATVSLPQQNRVELGLLSQAWIQKGEQSGLLTHIATTESVSWCVRMKS
jgi:hypothetical protein